MTTIAKVGDEVGVRPHDVEWLLEKLAVRGLHSVPAMLTALIAAAEVCKGSVVQGVNAEESFLNFAKQAFALAAGDLVRLLPEGAA